MAAKKRVLVRSDDLGYSDGINIGIAKAANEGFIKNIGIMTNMPETQSGYNMLHNPDSLCLGQHTNICVGRPLSDPKKIPSLVQENGCFKPSIAYRSAKEDFVNLDEVVLEIEAQYEAFKKLTGREPDYFEGHAVASDNFFKGLEIVAKRHNLNYFPFTPFGTTHFKNSNLVIEIDSSKPDYDPEETLKRICETEYPEGIVPVMICHPGYLDAYIMNTSSLLRARPLETDMAVNPDMLKWLQDHNIELVTYKDLP